MRGSLSVLRRRRQEPSLPADDAGFTLVEVIVAIGLLTVVMTAATGFFVSSMRTTGGQSARQAAIYLADQQLESVQTLPADKLVKGRTSASVVALHTSPRASALTAQDDASGNFDATATSTSTPNVPTSQTRTVNSVDYTVRTYINRCWLSKTSGACGPSNVANTTREWRVTVDVSWDSDVQGCPNGCFYAASTLIDPNADPRFNSNISVPTVTGVSPTSVPVGSTRTLTISGTNFIAGATVEISTGGGTFGAIATNTGTQITVSLTAGATSGSYVLSVVNPDGGRASTSLTLTGAPVVTSVAASPTPVAANTNSTLTITGSGFATGITVTATNATVGTVTFNTSNQITVSNFRGTLATGGSSVLTIRNADGGQTTTTIAYRSTPTITSVSPNVAAVGVPVAMTITGTGFNAGLTVSATSGAVSGVTRVSSTEIDLTYTGAAVGTPTLRVTNTDSGTVATTITVRAAPTFTGVSPASVFASSTTALTLTGTGFQTGAAVTATNGTVSSVNVVSATQITVNYQSTSVGTHTLRVTNPDGGTATRTISVTNAPAPTLSNVSWTPALKRNTNSTYTLTGTNFVSGAVVTATWRRVSNGNTSNATIGTTTVNSATQITVVIQGPGNQGAHDITISVRNPDGDTATISRTNQNVAN